MKMQISTAAKLIPWRKKLYNGKRNQSYKKEKKKGSISPFLISLVVSVDVKHHVYLLEALVLVLHQRPVKHAERVGPNFQFRCDEKGVCVGVGWCLG